MNRLAMVLLLFAAACGNTEPPTCSEAVGNLYDAGCRLFDLETNAPYSEGDVVTSCRDLLAAAPASCEDELADLRECWNAVPNPATEDSDCDCSAEQEALLTCE